MQRNQINRGITLVEILMVIAIISVVSAILWALLAPSMRKSSHRAAVKVGLKQATAAFAIYRADHDDKFPIDWKGMGFSRPNTRQDLVARGARKIIDAPISFPGSWAELAPRVPDIRRFDRPCLLTYHFFGLIQKWMSSYTPEYPFDEQKNSVFLAPFLVEGTGKEQPTWWLNEKKEEIMLVGYDVSNLAGYADGHVGWELTGTSRWQIELNYYRWYGGLKP
jgi:prepilin-type N-terminal cleavage/methylation domain-containing protein